MKEGPLLDDREIIARVRLGSTDSFNEIVIRYQSPIGRYLFRLTGDYHMAQDLAQETFVDAYRGILKTDAELSFKAWLYRIATNNAYQHLRHKRVIAFVPLNESDVAEAGPPADQDCVEDKAAVQETLLKIPAEQRTCMLLHFVEGLKYAEIGAVLGISEEAVRKRVFRGSQEFKKLFNSVEGSEK